MEEEKTLEITTRIGCRNMCKFCPQELLVCAYRKKPRDIVMDFGTFKQCLRTVPKDTRIDFSGMAEPWLNKDCTKMLLYAYDQGFKHIAVYTTCMGMTVEDVMQIEHIPFEVFYLHLADAQGNAHITVDGQYLEVLRALKKSNIKNFKYMTMEKIHLKLRRTYEKLLESSTMMSRAGNLDSMPKINHRGPIVCRWSKKLAHNVLLPNGDVLLCCNDYGMSHVLGNLALHPYASLFRSQAYRTLKAGMRDERSSDVLCRHCEYAIPDVSSLHTESKFKHVLKSWVDLLAH